MAPVIRVCSLNVTPETLFRELGRMQADGSVVQVFNPRSIINSFHLLAAYGNAIRAFEEHTNIAKSIGVEMLLFTAFTTQIGEAIKKAGISDGKAVLFSADGRLGMLRNAVRMDGTLGSRANPYAKRLYGIKGNGEDMRMEILTMMAESRLGD